MAYKPKKREPILRAAAEVFSKQGYHAATTAEIAVAAGIPPGSIYYHISTKEQLLFDVLMDGMQEAFQILKSAEAEETPRDCLTHLIARTIHSNCAMEHPGMSLNFAFIEPNILDPDHWRKYVAARDRYEHGVRKLIDKGIEEGQFATTNATLEARMILGVMNWIRVWFRSTGPLSVEEVVNWYTHRLIENILADGQKPEPLGHKPWLDMQSTSSKQENIQVTGR